MAKSSTLYLLITLLVFASLDGAKMAVEAKECWATWDCDGQDRCRADCKKRYGGIGVCDKYTAPFVPLQCFCDYDC
ncbi:unnamed protein product [Linum tenue]|uniref:Uncharacterized protein n=1 Tax=Linum tenue TaxID=586396 RepID=A0AAV0MYT6_9ROSI|nr:unnamed protein product [Linum tenue]